MAGAGTEVTHPPAAAGYTASAARVDGPAAALMAPYLGWTAFAGVLNAEIIRRNR